MEYTKYLEIYTFKLVLTINFFGSGMLYINGVCRYCSNQLSGDMYCAGFDTAAETRTESAHLVQQLILRIITSHVSHSLVASNSWRHFDLGCLLRQRNT